MEDKWIIERERFIHDYANRFRGTGRTTRLLLRAVELLLEGRNVSIVSYNAEISYMNARLAWKVLHAAIGDSLDANFVTPQRIEVTIKNTIYFLAFIPFRGRELFLRARDCLTIYDNNHDEHNMEWYVKERGL